MEELAKNVYIEDKYMGVTVAVISQPRGLVQIDAPPSPEDGRSWRASLMGMGNGPERVLINLDAHPDRTLGVRQGFTKTALLVEVSAEHAANRRLIGVLRGESLERGDRAFRVATVP